MPRRLATKYLSSIEDVLCPPYLAKNGEFYPVQIGLNHIDSQFPNGFPPDQPFYMILQGLSGTGKTTVGLWSLLRMSWSPGWPEGFPILIETTESDQSVERITIKLLSMIATHFMICDYFGCLTNENGGIDIYKTLEFELPEEFTDWNNETLESPLSKAISTRWETNSSPGHVDVTDLNMTYHFIARATKVDKGLIPPIPGSAFSNRQRKAWTASKRFFDVWYGENGVAPLYINGSSSNPDFNLATEMSTQTRMLELNGDKRYALDRWMERRGVLFYDHARGVVHPSGTTNAFEIQNYTVQFFKSFLDESKSLLIMIDQEGMKEAYNSLYQGAMGSQGGNIFYQEASTVLSVRKNIKRPDHKGHFGVNTLKGRDTESNNFIIQKNAASGVLFKNTLPMEGVYTTLMNMQMGDSSV